VAGTGPGTRIVIICGLKLTHDGAIALLDGDRLVFSVEIEKIANGPRYSPVDDLGIIPRVLDDFGYKPADVDEWVIDGWDGTGGYPVSSADLGQPAEIAVGPYRECAQCPDLLTPGVTGEFSLAGQALPYTSYAHAAAHLASAYCTSPFAVRDEPAFTLIWDGGMFPRLYWVEPGRGVENLGELFPLIGHAYAVGAHHFGPFRRAVQSPRVDDLGVAGKLMAYIALGQRDEAVLAAMRAEFGRRFESDEPGAVGYRQAVGGFGSLVEPSVTPVHDFFGAIRVQADAIGAPDEDVLATLHDFLGELLTGRLAAAMARRAGDGPHNVCVAGGCALNIKWNTALRALPGVRELWVPPFPNDSGSAIGAAAARRAGQAGLTAIGWDYRLGPRLGPAGVLPDGWTAVACDADGLARVLHETGRPVVVLHGRAELGPRALGGRSILAAPGDRAMKDELNRIKDREPYRPVAPVCLASEAPGIFDPGTPDPYMLFDHAVRPAWTGRIPAVVHLDGTARLQTVDPADDPFLGQVLLSYARLSGLPVLCNTSANLHGRGFFPDVASAMRWGRVDRIWSEGLLYQRDAVS
jgi:carbamoyltransferase